MKKNIFIAAIVLMALVGIALYIAPKRTASPETDFTERGYVKDTDSAHANQGLVLIYEKPGAPALEAKLAFDEKSVCRFGGQATPCISINQTIAGAYEGKRVFVEGTLENGGVRVKNLALDIEAGRKFGFIRSIEKNGNNYLVSIDEVEFLSGDAAVRAGVEDTTCAPKDIADCIPSMNNDFYIRNTSTSTETFNVTPDSEIAIFEHPGSPVLVPASADELFKQFREPKVSFMNSYAFKYLLDGATIASLEEQYTP